MASGLFYDAEHNGEPKSGALALLFGREEGLKDPGLDFCGHAATVVTHRHLDVLPRLRFTGKKTVSAIQFSIRSLNYKSPPVRHSVPGIDDQVHEHLLYLTGIHLHASKVVSGTELYVNVLWDQTLQHSGLFCDQRVQVEYFGRTDLLAADRQQALSQGRTPIRRFHDFAGVAAGGFICQLLIEQFGITADCRCV